MNPSPLRYPGGKFKLYKYVAEMVKLNNSSIYIEPFCGGAAIALQLLFDGIVKNVIINDYDYTIYCFWDSVLNHTNEFIDLIKNNRITIEEWERQKLVRNNISQYTKLRIGFSTFFLNRTNRSGIIDKAGPIGGKNQDGNYLLDCRFNKDDLINRIQKISSYRSHIFLYNKEALDFINEVIVNKRNTFTFFDPPYYSKGPGLYTNFYSHGDHANLANEIQKNLINRKWIVTYDNVNEIKSMYKKSSSIEFELRYSLENKRKGNEVMFFSKGIKRPINEKDLIAIK